MKESTIKIMLDDVSFKQKPMPDDVSQIQVRLKNANSFKEVSLKELLTYIGTGHTIIPAVMYGGTKAENWVEQQLFEIDVDNSEEADIIKPEEVINVLKDNNIYPFAYYYTFSSTDNKPKFRLLFKTDEVINDINKAKFIIKTLVDFIPQSDHACINVNRLYHGTNAQEKEVIMLEENAVITFDDIIRIYKNPDEEKRINKDNSFWTMVREYNWLDYIKDIATLGYKESGNRVDFKICPICKHKDDFSYFKDTNRFSCFGANGQVNGTFIDYLVITENITLKEAINKFKYEILGLSKEEEKQYYLNEDGGPQKDLSLVVNQLNNINLQTDYIKTLNWVEYTITKDGELIRKINCPKLAQFIRDNLKFIFVRDNAKSGILRFFYLDGYYKFINDDEMKGLIKACIPLEWQKIKDINEVLNLLYTDLNFVPVEDLNDDENIINFKNGVLHLDTMKLEPHSPKYKSTIRIPCNYYENVESPSTHYFDKFMDDLTEGNKEVKQLLLEVMGVVISNVYGYRMKQAIFQIGDGNTGKSRLKVLLTTLLGKENCSSIDLKMLESQFGKSQLFNKRLVGTNDLSYMTISSLDTFKQACGGDYINIEYKFENSFDILFKGVLWFCGNRLPIFGGDKGQWTYDRIIIVNCNNVIPEERRDKFLDKHLISESDYIISLCVKALKKVIENGYKYDIPDMCKVAKDKYIIDNDSFLSFYEECITERYPNKPIYDYCTRGKIFEVYKAYCKDNNKNYFNTKKEVKQILEKMGKAETIYAKGGNIYYKYITLNYDTNKEYSDICPMPDNHPEYEKEFTSLEDNSYDFESKPISY
jgi:P4 family phage/plasmid primase-like protien